MTVAGSILQQFVKENIGVILVGVVVVVTSLSVEVAFIPRQVSKIAVRFPQLSSSNGFLSGVGKYDSIPFILLSLAVAWFAITTADYSVQTVFSKVKPRLYTHIKSKITTAIVEQKQRNYDTGEAISRTNRVIEDMTTMAIDGGREIFPNVMALLVINVYIWIQSPKMGAIITTGLTVTILLIYHKSKKLLKQSQKESQNYHRRSEKLNDIVFNHEHIQLNNTSSEKLKESHEDDRDYSEVLQNVILEGRNTRFLVGIASVIVFFLTTWVLYRETSVGNYSKIKAGALVIVLLLYVDWTNQMGHFLPDILILMGKVKDSDKFLKKIIGDVRNSTRVKPTLTVTKSDIEIKNLQLTVGEIVIMDNFNLHVQERTKVGIYGKSGRGKSTLLKAIFNLFEPSGGQILIGGNNVKEYKPSSFKQAVVYINQDTSLENTTIMKNLQGGNTRTEEEVTEFVERFDLMGVFQNGLHQPIVMNGKLISKGMQKVIFMTRGLLRQNAKIFLIDEPTTSVDAATKLKLIEAIRTVCENKTVICVSHDDDLKEIMDVTIEI